LQTGFDLAEGIVAFHAGIGEGSRTIEVERRLDREGVIGQHPQLFHFLRLVRLAGLLSGLNVSGQLRSGLTHLVLDIFAHGGPHATLGIVDRTSRFAQIMELAGLMGNGGPQRSLRLLQRLLGITNRSDHRDW